MYGKGFFFSKLTMSGMWDEVGMSSKTSSKCVDELSRYLMVNDAPLGGTIRTGKVPWL